MCVSVAVAALKLLTGAANVFTKAVCRAWRVPGVMLRSGVTASLALAASITGTGHNEGD